MTTLEEKKAEMDRLRAQRTPFWDMPESKKELRAISERAMEILYKGDDALRPDIKNPGCWELIPRIVCETFKEAFNYLVQYRSTQNNDVYLKIGNLMEIGIEYMLIPSAEKPASFNPYIRPLDELNYSKRNEPYDDLVPADLGATLRAERSEHLPISFFDSRDVLYEVTKDLISTPNGKSGRLATEFGMVIFDWTLIWSCVLAFFRSMKEYVIKNKDANPEAYGIELKLGRVIEFGISCNGEPEDDDYDIFVSPGQDFKVITKHDTESEKGLAV